MGCKESTVYNDPTVMKKIIQQLQLRNDTYDYYHYRLMHGDMNLKH